MDDLGVRARFDDLGPGGSSFVLSEPSSQLVARDIEEVAEVLRSAEQAARDGRWVAGFVTYEAAPGLDPSLPSLDWPDGHPLSSLPLAWFGTFERCDEVEPVDDVGTDEAGTDDAETGEVQSGEVQTGEVQTGEEAGWGLDRPESWHRDAVAEVQEAIAAGDYYQLNLTARLSGRIADAANYYGPLAAAQAGRYNALIVTPEHTVISASPELFFSADDERVVTRPMKGTAPRGRWPAEDRRRAEALRSSPKERAENVMIVDLLRNDLGRLAEVGTVEVSALFDTERYPTVWQLTSTVTARVRPEVDLSGLFSALFPSGSVTGAPKRAAMRAITEIEQRPRGVYCGAIGYLRPVVSRPADPNSPGSRPAAPSGPASEPPGARNPVSRPAARFSVAIRTITRLNRSGYAEYGTGGAITACSNPQAEWAELLTKTAVLGRSPRPSQLFETIRWEPPTTLVNLERHLARLSRSADYFAFSYDRAALDEALAVALKDRAMLSRVRVRLERSGQVHVDVGELGAAPSEVRLALADHQVRSDDILLFHKQTDRRRYDGFRRGRPEADDVVLWNEAGLVTETTIANLAVQLDNRWWTPALSGGLLPGVERGRLLDEGVLAEREITVDELAGSSALAVVSSLRGWRPARLEV